jgi:beta-galactosidase
MIRGFKEGAPYWVMEQQCGNINWSKSNTGIRPGAVRLWTWHALAKGAGAVVYFRWRAGLFAQEMMHSGLLQHDASPGVGYRELGAMLSERKRMERINEGQYRASAALLLDYEDLWAVDLQPHRKDFGYQRHLFTFYRALARLGVQTDIVSFDTNLEKYRLVIAPTAYLTIPERVAGLAAYVRQGGTLLLGVRSGFKTVDNQVTDQPLPGEYAKLTGVKVSGWHALPQDVGYAFQSRVPGLEGPATFWIEGLIQAEGENEGHAGPSILVSYQDGPFAGQGALSEQAAGEGWVYYLGFYPTLAQAMALVTHLAGKTGLETLPGLPDGIVLTRRGDAQVLLNFNEDDRTIMISGEEVHLPGRDVLVR